MSYSVAEIVWTIIGGLSLFFALIATIGLVYQECGAVDRGFTFNNGYVMIFYGIIFVLSLATIFAGAVFDDYVEATILGSIGFAFFVLSFCYQITQVDKRWEIKERRRRERFVYPKNTG